MVYKHKNNKWSRMIAARKLAAANREKEAAGACTNEEAAATQTLAVSEAHPSDVKRNVADISEPAKGSDACTDILSSTALAAEDDAAQQTDLTLHVGSAGVIGAQQPEIRSRRGSTERKSPPPCTVNPLPQGCISGAPTTTAADALTEGERSDVCVPRVTDACYVPLHCFQTRCADSSTVAPEASLSSNYVAYILQSGEGIGETDSAAAPTTALGVWALQAEGGSCLQVVRWGTTTQPTVASSTNITTTISNTAAEDTTLPVLSSVKELMMYVDAEGRCFVLAPSSVAAVVHADEATAGHEGQSAVVAGSSTGTACPYAYYFIPTSLKKHFLALLWAMQQQWRLSPGALFHARDQTPSADAWTPASAQVFSVQLHPSRWAASPSVSSAEMGNEEEEAGHKTQQCSSSAETSSPNASKKTKKAKKRSRAATPPPPTTTAADPTVAAPSVDATTSASFRIPYVVNVTQPAARAANDAVGVCVDSAELTARGPAVALPHSTVFHLGNRLTPFPADHVL
jgi:hypothetical protein